MGASVRQGGRCGRQSPCPAPCNDSPGKRVLCGSCAVYSVRHCPRRIEAKRDSDPCGCENTCQDDDPDDDDDRDFHFVCRRPLWNVLTHRFPPSKAELLWLLPANDTMTFMPWNRHCAPGRGGENLDIGSFPTHLRGLADDLRDVDIREIPGSPNDQGRVRTPAGSSNTDHSLAHLHQPRLHCADHHLHGHLVPWPKRRKARCISGGYS